MACHGSQRCSGAVKSGVSLHVEGDPRRSKNSGFSGGLKDGRLCLRFGNYPAYYRGRIDFLASYRNGAADMPNTTFSRDAAFGLVETLSPEEMRDPFPGTGPCASLVNKLQKAFRNRGEELPGTNSSLYDLDWRLGSIADFSKEIFAGKVVLDLGCNIGKVSFLVASLMQAREVIGVDVDATLISKARSVLRDLQGLHELPVTEKCSTELSQPREFTPQAEDDKGAKPFRSDESSAQPGSGETALRSTPSTAEHQKRRLSSEPSECILPSFQSFPQGGLPCCTSTRESRFFIEKISSIQSHCVDVSALTNTASGGSRLKRIQCTAGRRAARMSASAGGLPSAEATPRQSGEKIEPERSLCGDLTEKKKFPLPASPSIAPTKRLCTNANALFSHSKLPSRLAKGRRVGGAHEAVCRLPAVCSNCPITQCERSSNHSGGISSRCEFPYNISFYAADALGGEPWRLPAVCGSTCTIDSTSTSCFCGLAATICEQQGQLNFETRKIEECRITPDYLRDSSSGCQQGYLQEVERRSRVPFDWKRFEWVFDVIICFSLTKWIHLHHGDRGILLLFSRLHSLLKAGGLLLLEPQDWASYRRARRVCASFKKQLKSIRLHPRCFCSILTCNRACSCSGELFIRRGASSSKTCPAAAENSCETQRTPEAPCEKIDSDSLCCSSHGCPFRLLAMLHPWGDLERKRAIPRVKKEGETGSSMDTTSEERCVETNVAIQHVQHTCLRECMDLRFSVHKHLVVKKEGGRESFESEELRAVRSLSSMLQENEFKNSTANNKLEVEAGEHIGPLYHESELHPPGLLQCQRRSALKAKESGALEKNFPVKSTVFKKCDDTCVCDCKGKRSLKTVVNESLRGKHVDEAIQGQGACHRGSFPPTVRESGDLRLCSSSSRLDPQEAGLPGGKDATLVKAPAAAVRSHTRKTRTDEVTRYQEDVLVHGSTTRKAGEGKQKMHNSKGRQPFKSRGTLADRFVYVLEKVSTDFTVCCKQLQNCVHAKAACTGIIGTDVTPNVTRIH